MWACECEEFGEAEAADGERRMERSDKRTITRGSSAILVLQTMVTRGRC